MLPLPRRRRSRSSRARSAGPALGMAVDVFGPDGKSLRGEVGELVCLKPWPAMTRGVWRDPERYLDAYWRRFPGVWTHGDWALDRRRRLLVPVRALRRHAEHRRQADRSGRDRVGPRRAPSGGRGRGRQESRTTSRARSRGASAFSCPDARGRPRARKGARESGRLRRWARALRPSGSCSSRRFRRRGAPRSSAVHFAPSPPERIPATSRRWRSPDVLASIASVLQHED